VGKFYDSVVEICVLEIMERERQREINIKMYLRNATSIDKAMHVRGRRERGYNAILLTEVPSSPYSRKDRERK
jgi:hypothetical protein